MCDKSESYVKKDNSWTRQNVSSPLGKYNNCEICKKSCIHGRGKMLTFPAEIQQFGKADRQRQKGALQKGLYLQWNFAKTDHGRATAKKVESNFDGFP